MKIIMNFLVAALTAIIVLAAGQGWAQTPAVYNDCSGSVTVGGTSQQVLAANVNRHYLFIENPSTAVSGVAAESLFANNDSAATLTGTSDELTNLGTKSYSFPGFVPTGTVNVNATTTGHKFVCKWN